MRTRGTSVVVVGALFLLGAGLALGVAASASSSGKGAQNPEAGMSDAQRDALHQAAHRQNDQFLLDFTARHGDPHALPVVEVPSYAAPPQTLPAAVDASTAIVIGRVSATTFQPSPTGGMPLATATLRVERIVKGQVAQTIVVQQLGGPVARGSGGALAVLDTDRLLLPGDHVMVMLSQVSGAYRPLAGAGVNIVRRDGTLEAEDSNPFGSQITGKAMTQLASTLGG